MMPYEPQEDSFLIQKHIGEYANGKEKVLEIGTGRGILAIESSKHTKNVLAVDINQKALKMAEFNAKKANIANITFKKSDLFSNVSGKYDLIIFNPPYLPNEPQVRDIAIDGGRKGYEVLERFLNEANNYLKPNGKILIVFSSLTKPDKIKEIVFNNCLDCKEIDRQKIAFEELYVWLIQKSALLKQIEKRKISDIKFFAKGHRGYVFSGVLNKKRVMIKANNPHSEAKGRVVNEVKFLKILQKYHFAPKVLISSSEFFVYNFIPGDFILNYIEKKKNTAKDKKEIIKILKKVFSCMFIIDKLGIDKEEMHHPVRHIVINNRTVKLLDFERANYTEKPKNVTQFIQFLITNPMNGLLKKKKINIDRNKMIALAKIYKKEMNKKNYNNILKELN